jgi:hypothetical protein
MQAHNVLIFNVLSLTTDWTDATGFR